MTIKDDLIKISDEEGFERRLAIAESTIAATRRDRDAARAALKHSDAEVESLQKQLDFVGKIGSLSPSPPQWLSPAKPKSGNRATVCTILSDSHFDEVVRPEEIGGVNAYNRDIATLRLEKYFQGVIKLSRDYLSGVSYDGAVLCLGGDNFSGDIHEELVQSNEDTLLGSMLYWLEHVAAGIDMLANEFDKVHVPVVVGNHGRRTRKPRAKMRVRDNFDWMLGMLLAREFKSDKRVTFDIPESADCAFKVNDTKFLLTHGDQFSGGSGIAGIWSPIMRGDKKKRDTRQAVGQPYDMLVMGHFHQLIFAPNLIVNGSCKGFDEYSYVSNFSFEKPRQGLWLVTPEHGVTWQAPVYVADRKSEGW